MFSAHVLWSVQPDPAQTVGGVGVDKLSGILKGVSGLPQVEYKYYIHSPPPSPFLSLLISIVLFSLIFSFLVTPSSLFFLFYFVSFPFFLFLH